MSSARGSDGDGTVLDPGGRVLAAGNDVDDTGRRLRRHQLPRGVDLQRPGRRRGLPRYGLATWSSRRHRARFGLPRPVLLAESGVRRSPSTGPNYLVVWVRDVRRRRRPTGDLGRRAAGAPTRPSSLGFEATVTFDGSNYLVASRPMAPSTATSWRPDGTADDRPPGGRRRRRAPSGGVGRGDVGRGLDDVQRRPGHQGERVRWRGRSGATSSTPAGPARVGWTGSNFCDRLHERLETDRHRGQALQHRRERARRPTAIVVSDKPGDQDSPSRRQRPRARRLARPQAEPGRIVRVPGSAATARCGTRTGSSSAPAIWTCGLSRDWGTTGASSHGRFDTTVNSDRLFLRTLSPK